MFNSYFKSLKYEEYIGLGDSGQESYKEAVDIKCLRMSGRLKIVHNEGGDYTESSVVYKTKEKLVAKSLLNGREIMECVPVEGFGLDCGYLSYLK